MIKLNSKLDNRLMRALKISEIKYVIAKTDKGDLTVNLKFEGSDKDYRVTLDAVPYDDKDNKKLLELFKEYNG